MPRIKFIIYKPIITRITCQSSKVAEGSSLADGALILLQQPLLSAVRVLPMSTFDLFQLIAFLRSVFIHYNNSSLHVVLCNLQCH
jgi:hypothetical protein